MESFFLTLGFSYTWSKILPYVLVLLLGGWIGLFLFKRAKTLRTKIIAIAVIGIPFGIYFAIHPIYQGDFSNAPRIVKQSEEIRELEGNRLVVVSLPGCVYCKESIARLKQVKERNAALSIEYVVTSYDEQTLAFYQEEIEGVFPIRLAENPEALADLAQGRFPAFVLVNGNQPLKVWSNNDFGVGALDEVVNSFK